MGRWGDGEMGRWGDGEIFIKGNCHTLPMSGGIKTVRCTPKVTQKNDNYSRKKQKKTLL
ncbi:hypothetical protein BJP36_44030 [Moorena producens JHB]|uniref:Uncharacterized protein n=1 Tax=Moorena producens (strain JHB) TaxID=1454205 RepID=A0A9Q9STE9_MOOP1|nr:hypothetical protein [Moorena producens]WAN69330.1 hypothetical protein BJP36_44030 [Moorena producens JHB]